MPLTVNDIYIIVPITLVISAFVIGFIYTHLLRLENEPRLPLLDLLPTSLLYPRYIKNGQCKSGHSFTTNVTTTGESAMNADKELITGCIVAALLVIYCLACIKQANTMRLPIIKRRYK